ncbi:MULTISPECIES: DMT family transporter [Psychrilyobacter]|uniref:DMT family transporter n=1 Tax=Psychrilyobacter piezotolerans TaxID=2293438 RepID=A0ABX9KDX1_9FUSO|nr:MULTISPECIES: DMT family transporter [Psychrilyobacter]MCS5421939.1 DMT family transporter [Psychrilyobacter sp. S5]NDI78957.1 DMT family transporter [Psychrilyobacter piezotolerans]RDE59249.1 DMT family transporter [Psychrilyobacter sp. S5]REI39809.1 DMT family transporter [Psychrilyobacter piezotolerans]
MKKDLIILHTAVLLFGLSGLFGKLIEAPAQVIVSGRVISAAIFLYIVLKFKNERVEMSSPTSKKIIILQGSLLFLHWFSFFQAIKLSSVALGLLSFSSFPIFTTFMEPLFFKEKLEGKKIITAMITFIGISMVIPLNGIDVKMLNGIGMGVFSGFSFAILAIMNKKFSSSVSGIKLTFYQCLGASFWSIPVLLLWNKLPSVRDIFFMVILGVVFTGIAHTLFVLSLKRISASTVSVTTCLEPVYGIIFAAFILGEIPTLKIIMGSTIIILAAFVATKMTVLKDKPAV